MIVIHEVGHFVSCSFQMVNGKNLTQTKEWKKIYKSEKRKYVSEAVFEYTGNKTEVDLVKAQEECYPVAVRKLYETIKNVTEAYGMPIIDLTTA